MFGEKAKTAVTEELQQLHDQETSQPVHPQYISHEEHKHTLRYVMLLQ